MKRRILFPMLAAIVFAVTDRAGNAEASVFHRLRGRRPACCKPAKQALHGRHAAQTRSTLPTWTWDAPIGLRMWKWPPYYQR